MKLIFKDTYVFSKVTGYRTVKYDITLFINKAKKSLGIYNEMHSGITKSDFNFLHTFPHCLKFLKVCMQVCVIFITNKS